jgi:hypothetical protein
MKVGTRKLTCLAVILAIYFIVMVFQPFPDIPIVSVVLGLLIPIFGMKQTIILRAFLLLTSMLIKFNITLFIFYHSVSFGILYVSSVSIFQYVIMLISYYLLQKRLIF